MRLTLLSFKHWFCWKYLWINGFNFIDRLYFYSSCAGDMYYTDSFSLCCTGFTITLRLPCAWNEYLGPWYQDWCKSISWTYNPLIVLFITGWCSSPITFAYCNKIHKILGKMLMIQSWRSTKIAISRNIL